MWSHRVRHNWAAKQQLTLKESANGQHIWNKGLQDLDISQQKRASWEMESKGANPAFPQLLALRIPSTRALCEWRRQSRESGETKVARAHLAEKGFQRSTEGHSDRSVENWSAHRYEETIKGQIKRSKGNDNQPIHTHTHTHTYTHTHTHTHTHTPLRIVLPHKPDWKILFFCRNWVDTQKSCPSIK